MSAFWREIGKDVCELGRAQGEFECDDCDFYPKFELRALFVAATSTEKWFPFLLPIAREATPMGKMV